MLEYLSCKNSGKSGVWSTSTGPSKGLSQAFRNALIYQNVIFWWCDLIVLCHFLGEPQYLRHFDLSKKKFLLLNVGIESYFQSKKSSSKKYYVVLRYLTFSFDFYMKSFSGRKIPFPLSRKKIWSTSFNVLSLITWHNFFPKNSNRAKPFLLTQAHENKNDFIKHYTVLTRKKSRWQHRGKCLEIYLSIDTKKKLVLRQIVAKVIFSSTNLSTLTPKNTTHRLLLTQLSIHESKCFLIQNSLSSRDLWNIWFLECNWITELCGLKGVGEYFYKTYVFHSHLFYSCS